MHSFDQLIKKINNAPSLEFGDIINNSIELYKKLWAKGFLVVLLILISAVIISIVFGFIGLGPKPFVYNPSMGMQTILDFYSSNAIYSIPQNILIGACSLGFVAGLYKICNQVDSGLNGNDDYFYFFKKEYFSKILMLSIISTGIGVVAQLLLFIPYIYAFVPIAYFSIIFSNNPDLSEMEIVKASFALGNKKWFISFGTIFVSLILAMLGILACFVGLLVTISLVYLPVFFIYKDVIGFHQNSEIDQIGMPDDSTL